MVRAGVTALPPAGWLTEKVSWMLYSLTSGGDSCDALKEQVRPLPLPASTPERPAVVAGFADALRVMQAVEGVAALVAMLSYPTTHEVKPHPCRIFQHSHSTNPIAAHCCNVHCLGRGVQPQIRGRSTE